MALASKSNLRLTALALALASIGAPAQTVTWATDTSGLWTLPTNWTPLGPPPGGSDVVITVTGTKTITHDLGNDSIHTLTFEAGTPDPNALLLINTGSSLNVTSGGTNGGVIRADNGTMSFTGGNFINSGTVSAINSGTVNITSGTVFSGGTLSTASGGQIVLAGSATLDGVSNGAITNTGTVVEADNQTTYFSGMIVNNGGITVGTNADFRLLGSNNATFSGTGTITLNAGNSRIFADVGSDVLTFGAGQTVQGQGQIGNNSAVIHNAGVITANVANGTLTIDPTDGEGNFINTGTLRAENGGTLQMVTGNYTNQGATISALAGSAVVFTNGAQVAGGTVSTVGSGTATFYGSSLIDGSTHGAISLNGNVALGDNQIVYAVGTVNDNTLTIGTNADLRIAGNNTTLTLANNGTTTLVAGNSRLFSDTGSATLVNALGNTIQGQGSIGINQTLIQNAGLITANVNGGLLTLDPTDGEGNFINTGTLRAENGGTLALNSGNYTNNGATITALAGSTIVVNGGASIAGGTVSTAGSGTVTLNSGAFLDGSTHGAISLNGNIIEGDNQTAFIVGNVNDNTLTIGTNADLRIAGNNTTLTLANNGTTTLVAGNSRLFSDNGTSTLVNTAGNTIQGQGQIGLNNTVIQNAGLITANVGGGTLTLDPVDGEGNFINTGTLRAENGGTLAFNQGNYTNNGATITALAGSAIVVNGGASIAGGTVSTAGNGTVTLNSGSFLDGSTHGAISLTGNIIEGDNQTVYIVGNVNDNTLTIGTDADLRIAGNNTTLTLGNNGTTTLVAGNSRLFSDNGSSTLVNTAGNTIQGQGNIGLNNTVIQNAGLITANVGGGTLTLDPAGGQGNFINTGTLRAENGGNLQFNDGTYDNGNGTITARTGSTVSVTGGATIQGGLLSTVGTGVANFYSNSVMDGATRGTLTLSGNVNVVDNQAVYALGTIVDNNLSVGNNADLRMLGSNNLTLTGGTTTLVAGGSRIFGDSGSDILTNTASNIIQGQGQVGVNQAYVTNAGLITANVMGGTMTIDPSDGDGVNGGLLNTGTLRAENGGNLQLNFGHYNNAGGTIAALDGSTVSVYSAYLEGGTLTSAGSGAINLFSSAVLDGTAHGALTNTGNVVISANQAIYGTGSIIDNGTITQQSNSDFRVLGTSNLTLSGTGTYTLTAAGARIFGDDGGDTLTNGAGHTINGFGQIGVNQLQVTNAGLINANANGQTLNLVTSSAVVNQSTGVLQASNNGTLYIDKAVTGTGTIRTDSGGTVILNQAAQTGQLINNANLALGTNNVTVSADYNNANFGTGNSFNKHAGVTGTGQILAAGDVAQAITGSNVTNGTTGSPTLTIGNVRVGGTTYNYQVANTGTNGPAIRGALETSVNGGNITDSRLSGSGVTASNYGPVGTGANSGNLGVTFTVNTAGALAPLSGQSVHIANNFDNVSEQTLNIALANGAAAYNVAVGSATPTPITFGNVRVGGTDSQALSIHNGAAAGAYSEDLNAAFGTSTGAASATGSASGVLAGSTNSSAMRASLSTATAGAISGAVTVNYATAGAVNGVSNGLGTLAVGSQTIALSGNVYNTAVGSTTPTPITFGNVRVGSVDSQALSVHNGAAAGAYSEDLNAAFGTSTGAASGTGSVTGVLAGATNSSALLASLSTATAGAITGGVTVNYATAGTVNGVSNGLGTLGVGSQTVALSGNVYNTAVGSTTPSPVAIANQRVGGTASQALTVANTAAAGNYSEALNASISATTGTATSNGGSISNIAAGANNASALTVGVNTTSAGAKTGNVTIAYQSDGTGSNGHSGLAAISAGTQTVAVSGNVYQTAAGTVLTAPLNFGVVQVGQVVSQTLSIQNSATGAAGYVEDLNASFGAATGTGANKITGTGSLTGLAAGATNSSALTVGVNTSSAGTVSGSIAVNYFSAGTVNGNSNGLGTLAVGSSNYGVSGTIQGTATVVDQAAPVINNSPIALGNVRIGSTSPTGFVSVTNQATGNQQAALNASINGNAPITATGSFNLLAPGATNNTSLAVGLDTSSAGAKNGTATIAFVSDASNIGGCGSNCQMTLASQDVNVTGAVYRLASPTVGTNSVTVAGRVGTAGPTTSIGITNTSPDVYTEGLTATRGTTSAGFTSSGSITNLVAGASSSAIGVTLNTTTAGTFTGTQALNFVSTGAGTDNATDLALASQSVTLNGKVYTSAAAQQNTTSVNFGIVHVGDTVAAQGVSVTNSAPVTALNDVLVASAVGATGPFTASGSLGAGLAAQQTSANGLSVGLNATTAGNFSGTATFSAASHDGDLSDAALGNLAVNLVGQVNNYASDTFSKTTGAGTLTQNGSVFTLDYGTLTQNSGTETTSLVASNNATGPADLLNGIFQFLDPADFGEQGFSAFSNLAAGSSDGPLTFSFDTSSVGSFMDTIVLHGVGTNASGYSGAIGDIELIVRGVVNAAGTTPPTNVPEPDSLLLLGLGLPLLFLRRGRKQQVRH